MDRENEVVGLNLDTVRVQESTDETAHRWQGREKVGAFIHRAAPCIASKLPPEIIGEIFLNCLSQLPIDFPCDWDDPPLLLCQICSAWRHVALGTPKLWNSISLRPDVGQVSSRAFLDRAKTWISRSGVSPLTIHYSIREDLAPALIASNSNPLLNLVIPFSNRLREIHLSLPPHCFIPLWALPPGSVELLEFLHLQAVSYGNGHRIHEDWALPADATVFNSASRLHHVTFISSFSHLDVEAARLPWSQLTHLDFIWTCISPDGCHTILHQCTNLVECTMTVVRGEKALTRGPATLLPYLRKFVLYLLKFHEIGIFLEPFTFPVLEDFDFETGDLIDWSPSASAFLASHSSLKRLAMSQLVGLEGSDLVPSLENMMSLVELTLEEENTLADGHIIGMLSHDDFLPKLEVVNLFVGHYGGENPYVDIVEMINLRWWPDPSLDAPGDVGHSVARLKKVVLTVHDTDSIDDESRSRFDQCIEEGLDLQTVS